ncbi:MAG: DNA/RNA non-specific endonuclease [Bacteroidota bacterium]
MRPLLLSLAALLLVAGCDTQAPASVPEAALTSDPAYNALLADVGGLDGMARLLDAGTEADLRAALARHDIAFERIGVTDAVFDDEANEEARLAGDTIVDCPQYFRTADRQKWIQLVGAGGSESHYIDGSGRPLAAYKRLPPVVTAPRSSYCQTQIGNWASPASSYDGGHLIGSQLGGWGRRANIVPQHLNFNRGNWARIENQLADCDRLGSGVVAYYVTVSYANGSTLTPYRFTSNVSISGSAWENAYFSNTTKGGSNGDAERAGMVSWLQSRGCV